jgi:predicted AAA+ superfamily ATPase
MELLPRLFSAPKDSFFLFGPRGTGKSTWLRTTYPDAPLVDLLDPVTHRAYVARPERLAEVVAGNPSAQQVIVDEVQRVPALLDVVHKLIEERGRHTTQFILTGSSARKLKRTGVDLLAGRLVLRSLHPFMAAELGEGFDLGAALEVGLLPLVLGAADPRETLRSYVSLYLQQEVQAEGLVRNIGNFARFLEAISFSHAAMLNTSAVARECEVGRKTVEGYVAVLEDLLLGFRVRSFTKRARRHVVQHPKFYYADAGVFRSVRPRGALDRPQEIGGACLEGLVAQHLRAWIAYAGEQRGLFFWRTKSGVEVDFVVYGPDTFAGIEVKSSSSVHSGDVRSLRAFREDYPQAQVCLLHGGAERRMVNGVPCLPCGRFLRDLIPGKSLPIA